MVFQAPGIDPGNARHVSGGGDEVARIVGNFQNSGALSQVEIGK
jgi:hypothetical protein